MSTDIAVKEQQILFSAPMVRALLAGTKTMTRRVVKEQPRITTNTDASWYDASGDLWRDARQYARDCCPYGDVGTRLWVRETWGITAAKSVAPFTQGQVLQGEYDILRRDLPLKFWYRADDKNPDLMHWRPSIHMPRVACRITLEITDVRVQRLQEIDESDAIAEGAPCIDNPDHDPEDPADDPPQTHLAGFVELWNIINGPRGFGWDANPWVFAISFKRI